MSYNKLSEMCFTDCVRDFTSRDVKDSEVSTKKLSSHKISLNFFSIVQEKCSLNCMEKYLKMNQRVSQRFQEFQMIANENALAMAQKTGKL